MVSKRITELGERLVLLDEDLLVITNEIEDLNFKAPISTLQARILAAIPPSTGSYQEPMSVFNNNSPEILFNGRGEVVTSYVA